MTEALTAPAAAMQGGGFYNRHSTLQAANLGSALPLLVEAAGTVPADGAMIGIADYGASQGRNSMAPMAAAIDALRPRIGPDRPITVSHVDLPRTLSAIWRVARASFPPPSAARISRKCCRRAVSISAGAPMRCTG